MKKILLLVLVFLSVQTYGVVIIQNFTPESLNSGDATFFNGSPTLSSDGSGSFLDLPTTVSNHSKLMEVALLDAGTLPTDTPTTIRLDLNIDSLTADNDLLIVLTDGVDALGIMRFDNGGGGMHPQEGAVSTVDTIGAGLTTLGDIRMPFSSQYSIEWVLDTTTSVKGIMSGVEAIPSPSPSRVINRDAALNLVFMNNNNTELYRIRSFTATVTNDALDPVPEPSTYLMLLLGLSGLLYRRQR